MVGELLHEMGCSRRAARKTEEGQEHGADRDAQFQHINESVKAFQAQGQPAISVDSKKKELVGNYKNGGREYHRKGQAPRLLITADRGGGNGARARAWKVELRRFAAETGLMITVRDIEVEQD